MQTAGIVLHPTRQEARTLAEEARRWLTARGLTVYRDTSPTTVFAQAEGRESTPLDFLITLGGDGTILTAARAAAPFGVPILGVHLGRFGFIAESHPDALFSDLERILAQEARLEERMMIQAEVWRQEQKIVSRFGLNEVMVKTGMSHLMQLRTRLGGSEFATYPADGVVIATPTGSTAYALSAGGPIVTPTVQALLMVPVCPHTLNARPLLLPYDEQIEIEVESQGNDIIFAIDGIDPFPLESGDRIVIRRADYVTRLFTFGQGNFYRKIHSRYLYGERLNEWGR